MSVKRTIPVLFFFVAQELSNLLVVEDKVEEEIADVETQLEVLHKQVTQGCY